MLPRDQFPLFLSLLRRSRVLFAIDRRKCRTIKLQQLRCARLPSPTLTQRAVARHPTMSDLQYPAYSVLALISAVVVLIPLPWHLEAWNAGTCLYMIWTSIACLNFGINTIIWHNNALNPAPVWCDICTSIAFSGYSSHHSQHSSIPGYSRCLCGYTFCIAVYQPSAV